jgi:hypothetical protein
VPRHHYKHFELGLVRDLPVKGPFKENLLYYHKCLESKAISIYNHLKQFQIKKKSKNVIIVKYYYVVLGRFHNGANMGDSTMVQI